ncbi:MAG TPA: hypothetical protein V6D15_13625 [Oculatellaceae cyanobacterium]|jgi:LPS sulfotransferase NodH
MDNKLNFFKKKFEFSNYLNLITKNSQLPDTKFVIFSHYRTGSHLLISLLNCHPDIYCDTEIFNPLFVQQVIFPFWYIQGLSTQSKTNIYGCNIKIVQLLEFQKNNNKFIKNLILKLVKHHWKIIYLKRQNIVKQTISNMSAILNKEWQKLSNQEFNFSKIYINPQEIASHIEYHENFLLQEQYFLDEVECLNIVYEQDLLNPKNHQTTADKVFAYLGINSVEVATIYLKATSNNLSDVIGNYEEVFTYLKKTKYAHFLNDDYL